MRRYSLFFLALLLLGMKGEPFRYSREIKAKSGWSVLELPDDVLAAARPGLADVRISGKDGELGYVLERELAPVALRLELRNVESRPGSETTALLDRGPNATLCSELALEVGGSEPFLKPLSLEASPDGERFATITRGSIFRLTPGAALPRLRFAPSDRRFLRIRLDDTNSAAVRPIAARCLQSVTPEAPLREVALTLQRTPGNDTVDRFSLALPIANLPITSVRLIVNGLAFAREARIYESVLFRDELSRRLVGHGRLERSATGEGSTTLVVGELSGAALELEIDRPGGSLDVRQAIALVEPQRLVFIAPDEGGLTLLYGSESARAPSYDLGQALSRGRPTTLVSAELGAVKDAGAAPTLASPARSPVADPTLWKRRQRIGLPPKGPVAFLDLEGETADKVHEVRVVDAAGRQVPFLVETSERSTPRTLPFTQKTEGTRTLVTVALDPKERLSRLELRVTAPAYFDREVAVLVPQRDARGPTGQLEVARARWVKQPDDDDGSLSIPLSLSREPTLTLSIENSDNPALALASVVGRAQRRRINFLFEAGDTLELWSSNDGAAAPRYDLQLIAAAVLKTQALPATLAPAPAEPTRVQAPETPRWFWWVAVGAGLLVVLALVRVQRKSEV
jgi:hypothetical protein